MRKVYKIQQWYSLEDAAERLTLALNEPFKVSTILQMALEGHLILSCYLHQTPAREILVAPDTWAKKVEHLVGPYRLDFDRSPVLKSWISTFFANSAAQMPPVNGYFVRGEDDRVWKIMSKVSLQELREVQKDMTRALDHPDYYYPCPTLPTQESVGIIKGDLEALEALLESTSSSRSRDSLSKKERDSLLKLVLGMAMDKYGYDPNGPRNSAAGQISSKLKLRDIAIDEDTVRKWLNEAKEVVDLPPA